MEKKVILVFVLVMLLPSAIALNLTQQVELVKELAQGKELHGPLGVMFGDQRVNVYVIGQVGVMGVVTKDKKLRSISTEPTIVPTGELWLTQETMQIILTASHPLNTSERAWKAGFLTYKPQGAWQRIRFWLLSFFSGFGERNDDAVNKVNWSVELLPYGHGKYQPLPELLPLPGQVAVMYVVELTDDGFSTRELNLKVGDTLQWKNTRQGRFGRYTDAFIIGGWDCPTIKSEILHPEDTFTHTFTEPGRCTITDGIYTRESMFISIE